MSETALLATQAHFVADLEETPLGTTDQVDESAPPGGLWLEAWRSLRKRPLFIVSSLIILVLIVMAIVPGLFASKDPAYCVLQKSGSNVRRLPSDCVPSSSRRHVGMMTSVSFAPPALASAASRS